MKIKILFIVFALGILMFSLYACGGSSQESYDSKETDAAIARDWENDEYYEDGYKEGYNEGYDEGYDAAYNAGYEKGKEAFYDGYEEGYRAGYYDGENGNEYGDSAEYF